MEEKNREIEKFLDMTVLPLPCTTQSITFRNLLNKKQTMEFTALMCHAQSKYEELQRENNDETDENDE